MSKKRIVIVGAGFGGMEAARCLDSDRAEIVLIDRVNHHLFQPLFYQVATAALSPSDIATASRTMLRGRSIRVLNTEVAGVDPKNKVVRLIDDRKERYDHLVLATGSAYSFFGHSSWEPHAFVLKSLEDALEISDHLLSQFEKATLTTDPDKVQRLLTIVVVGGGPTGVELAGTTAELTRSVLARDFATIRADTVRIVLCEATDRLLSSFSMRQSNYAAKALRSLGVDVRLNAAVEKISEGMIDIAGERLATSSILWCAGTKARPAAQWVGIDPARSGGIAVNSDCSVPGHPDIFTIGDVASFITDAGGALPALGPVAKQQGRYVAKLLNARLAGKQLSAPFRYRDWGSLAVIGRSRAVATFAGIHFKGLSVA